MSNGTNEVSGVEAIAALRHELDGFSRLLGALRGDDRRCAAAVLRQMAAAIDNGRIDVTAGVVAIETREGLSFLQPIVAGLSPENVAQACLIQAYGIIRDPGTLMSMMGAVVRAGAAKGELATLGEPKAH